MKALLSNWKLTAVASLVVMTAACGVAFGRNADAIWELRVERALGDGTCERSPAELDPDHYTGLLIDTHFHIPHLPDSAPVNDEFSRPYFEANELEIKDDVFPLLGANTSVSDIACVLKAEGTYKALSYFPVFENIEAPALEVASRAIEMEPDLFIPFINTPGPGNTPTVKDDVLQRMLGAYPGLFVGYGEIGLYNQGPRDKNRYLPDGELFNEIFATAGDQRLAVYLHPGEDQADNLSNMLAAFPGVNFILHGDQVESEITDLMARHSNVYFTVDALYGDQYLLHPGETAESFLQAVSDYGPLLEQDWETWQGPIEAYPYQFLWGTDRGGSAVWSLDYEVGRRLNDYGRAFIAGLDESVQEKFAYKNALMATGQTNSQFSPDRPVPATE